MPSWKLWVSLATAAPGLVDSSSVKFVANGVCSVRARRRSRWVRVEERSEAGTPGPGSAYIHENTCFSPPSGTHRGLTPHLVPISIALVALPPCQGPDAQLHKGQGPLAPPLPSAGPRTRADTEEGPRGFQREDTAPSSQPHFSLTPRNVPAIKSARMCSAVVCFVSFCEAGKRFGVTSNEQIRTAKIRLGTRYSLPCVLWRATSDYKDFLYSACFICHLFPIWTL